MSENPSAQELLLSILTPEELLYEGLVRWVQVPLEDGLIGIWPGHAPLVGAVGAGEVRYATAEAEGRVPVEGGVLRVDAERCVVLVGLAPTYAEPAEAPRDELVDELERALQETFSEEQIEELQQKR
jgi:F-type H+-transporting ATPase subunit epsilon